jgi:DNA-directed DNA polymerase III PolC
VGDSFTHLHVHTEYSMLDGAARLNELVAAAAADGMPGLGITDHGNMYGVLEFYKECRKQGIKPIIGTEAYLAHESRHERPSRRGRVDDSGGETEGGGKLYYHMTLLAETDQGYRNMIQLSSLAFLEGYYYKPRMDFELLDRHHEGLIGTTGCLGGHVLQALMNGDEKGALEKAARLQDIFGRDNLFVELQDHGIKAQIETNPKLIEIARKLKAPLLATNDSHYTNREDHIAHDALLCVQTASLMSDPNRFKFEGEEHYLKPAHEMRYLFRDFPTACDNSLWIAERCEVEIEFGKAQLPNFPLPEGFADDAAYLQSLTMEGAKARWGDNIAPDAMERLAYELKVIGDMGFSSYFLIVWDLIKHARDMNIRVGPGRGSAAGCAVAYCLRITDLDPIKYDLLFERFLNPSRVSMPDIDMDFDSRYRDEMIRYAAERYGRDKVAQIVTFSTIKARAAVRDAARVLGYPYGVGDKIAKAMPPLVMGKDTPLYACLDEHPKFADGYKSAADLREMYASDEDARKVIDVAKGLEGLRRQDGIHAAAVVITRDPLTTYLPIQRKPEAGGKIENAPTVTQYEMHGVEELGLLKMDFLGLRNLDVIQDTVDMIRARELSDGAAEATFDVDVIALDDDPTLALLRRGDSIGVFQLEGGPMRALMRSLAPTSFDDVAALVALYRPGPMSANMHNDYADRKNGRKPITYIHPEAEALLGDTYGLMIYQESVMRVAQKFAGYSLAEADNLRKACLAKGTRLLTKTRGYVPIEDIMQLSDRRVQTIDTTSATSRFEAVDDVWSVGVKPAFRLTTATGYTVTATADHKFFRNDEWVELGAVEPGDLLAVSGVSSSRPSSQNVDRLESWTRWTNLVAVLDQPMVRWGDFGLDRVVSIEPAGDVECFDFQMANPDRPYALAEDVLVHNCGKKDRAVMAKERAKFVEGAAATGYGSDLGTELFDIIEPFADYAFNKSHSYGYGYIAYQTAFLKAHYPVEYLACLLTSVKANLDKAAVYLAECRNMGVKVLTPDVNLSMSDFVARRPSEVPDRVELPRNSPGAIPFGLSAVRNVGEALVGLVVADREKGGPYADFYEFADRVDPSVLNKRTVESLIKAGAFDSMGHKRRGLLTVFEQIIDTTLARRRERDQGVMSLFGELEKDESSGFSAKIAIPDMEFDKSQRLRFEKEMLGLYVSDHPLLGAEHALRRRTDGTIAEMAERGDQGSVALGGVITGLSRKFTKKGDPMAVFVLEDLQSSIEVTVFSRTMLEHGHKLVDDAVVIVRGRLESRDETPKLLCQDIEIFDGIVDGAPPLRLKLNANALSEEKIATLKAILLECPGESPVFLHLGRGKVLRLTDDFCVDINRAVGEIRVAFGHDAVIL